MSEQHTPGPWVAKYSPGAGWGVWADLRPALGETFSRDFPLSGSDALKNQKIQISYETWVQFPSETFNAMQGANTVLMAAAPEMLDALQVVRMSRGWQEMSEQLQALVNAAIAKASPTTTDAGVAG
jgi:hypothetical protein